MIVKEGYELHPLRKKKILHGNDVIFELNSQHDRSWFILDLAIDTAALFVPQNSDCLVTADGLQFNTFGKRR